MSLHAWFLVGPTAVGKSAVAQCLAERLKAAIISADSMLVYKGMDIGTAKPTVEERGTTPYWGIDCVEPDRSFSVGDYLRVIQSSREETSPQPQRFIVTGGTGLYVDCLLRGLPSRPALDPALRARLEALQQQGGVAALQHELDRVAPGRLGELADPRNPRRLIRAIELAAQGITSKSMLARNEASPVLVGLNMESAALHARMTARVQAMFEQGLLAEAAALRQRYRTLSDTAQQAIGYAEAWACLDGTCTRAEAETTIVRRTRQLAKRQLTWFRHQAAVQWIDVQPGQSVPDIADQVQAQWERHGPTPLSF